MRLPISALMFLISSFIFFVSWAVASYFLNAVTDAMTPLYAGLGDSTLTGYLTLLPTALGILCAIFFVTGILLIFVVDALADEPEMYYRQ